MRPDDALAAEYALGLLEGPAYAQAERRVAVDRAFAAQVAFWEERFLELDEIVEPEEATEESEELLWSRIAAELPKRSGRAVREERPSRFGLWWESVAFWRIGAFAAASAAAVALAVPLVFRGPEKPVFVAVLLTDQAQPGAVVEAFADGRTVLIPLGLIPVPQDRSLQVWTLPSVARGPVPIGLLRETRSADLDLDDAPAQAQLFEITLEPAAGSPTGRPTGPILMKGLANRTF